MQYEFLIEKAGFKLVAYLNGLNGTIGSGIKVGLAVTKICVWHASDIDCVLKIFSDNEWYAFHVVLRELRY